MRPRFSHGHRPTVFREGGCIPLTQLFSLKTWTLFSPFKKIRHKKCPSVRSTLVYYLFWLDYSSYSKHFGEIRISNSYLKFALPFFWRNPKGLFYTNLSIWNYHSYNDIQLCLLTHRSVQRLCLEA